MSVEDFNSLEEAAAVEALSLCCVSQQWIAGMVNSRPFASQEAARNAADTIWRNLSDADFLEAFEGHPKIGDVDSLAAKYGASQDLAASEQSGMATAERDVIERLAAGNQRYEERYGFIFIVCASGKSAAEMCEILEARLDNSREKEMLIAAEEQRKILRIRLEKLL